MASRGFIVLALAGLAVATPLAGQQTSGSRPATAYMTRGDLNVWVARLEGAIRSPAYSEALKARAQAQVAEARARLTSGDFQVGDQVQLVVQGESSLTDTFTVRQGQELLLPLVGPVSLHGVLHSELESHVASELARRIREPRVQARPMVRVAIEGAVMHPGFYSVPVSALLGDALMVAGGLTGTARAEEARLQRGGRDVLTSAAFGQAMTAGRTLDQLDVRAGDRLMVPERRGGDTEARVRTLTLLLSIPLTVFALRQML